MDLNSMKSNKCNKKVKQDISINNYVSFIKPIIFEELFISVQNAKNIIYAKISLNIHNLFTHITF